MGFYVRDHFRNTLFVVTDSDAPGGERYVMLVFTARKHGTVFPSLPSYSPPSNETEQEAVVRRVLGRPTIRELECSLEDDAVRTALGLPFETVDALAHCEQLTPPDELMKLVNGRYEIGIRLERVSVPGDVLRRIRAGAADLARYRAMSCPYDVSERFLLVKAVPMSLMAHVSDSMALAAVFLLERMEMAATRSSAPN